MGRYLFFLIYIFSFPLIAQELSEEKINLKSEEIAELRAIISKPIDPNSLNITKTELYRQKDMAAYKLGDVKAQENILREWASIPNLDSNIDARWTLMGLLFQTENRKEAFTIGEQIIKEIKGWPPSEVRIRTIVALQYINDNNLTRAKQLLDDADLIILNKWSSSDIKGPTAIYWKNRAELEFYRVKATYLLRIGKWNEGLINAKKATEKGVSLLTVEKAVDLRQQNYGRMWAINSFVELAQHQISAGMYAQADLTLRDTYKLTREHGFSENKLNHFYNTTADLKNANGQFNEAWKYTLISEKINDQLGFNKGSSSWLYVETRKLRSLIGQDKWKEALEELDNIDNEVKRVNGDTHFARVPYFRGYIYLKNGKYLEATKLFEGSLKWNIENFGENHYLTSFSRGMYASALFRSGNLSSARTEFEKVIKNINSPDILYGDYVEDALRKKYKKYIYENYLELLAKNSASNLTDISTMFQIGDFLNASSIQSALGDASIRSAINIPGLSDNIRQDQDAKNEIVSLNAYIVGQNIEGKEKRNIQIIDKMKVRLNELQNIRSQFKNRIQKEFPEYYDLIKPRSPSIQEVSSLLRPDELFISIIPLENISYLFSVDSLGNGKFFVIEKGENYFRRQVDTIRKTLDLGNLSTNSLPSFDYKDSYELYKTLFSPIEDTLNKKNHLIISTSGSLSTLPFAVLIKEKFVSVNLSNARWLINSHAISNIPSASGFFSLNKFGQSQKAQDQLLAWGDPKFNLQNDDLSNGAKNRSARTNNLTRSFLQTGIDKSIEQSYLAYDSLPELPETRDEVLQIAKSLNDSDPKNLFLGAAATRESVMRASISGDLAKKRVVVFATHGLQAGDLPGLDQPALAMAANPDKTISPMLTLEDVMSLKMNADWTVLSACNTAGSDGKAGEALSGLSRGFFFAGSRSLLVTHWSVESESAMMITTHTFDYYTKNQSIRRADALRLGILDVMKNPKFGHPAYWAPYALVGNGGL